MQCPWQHLHSHLNLFDVVPPPYDTFNLPTAELRLVPHQPQKEWVSVIQKTVICRILGRLPLSKQSEGGRGHL